MTFAVVGILSHFSKTMLLFFIPQILNFLYSVPQLFGLIPCPRHRLPRYTCLSNIYTVTLSLPLLFSLFTIFFLFPLPLSVFSCLFPLIPSFFVRPFLFPSLSASLYTYLPSLTNSLITYSHCLRLNRKSGLLGISWAQFNPSHLSPLGKLTLSILQTFRLVTTEAASEEGEIRVNNLTIINFLLRLTGPTHEQTLTVRVLLLQVAFSGIAFFIRYGLVKFFYP